MEENEVKTVEENVTAESDNKLSNKENREISKFANSVFSTALILFIIVAVRLILSIGSLEDIFACLVEEKPIIIKIGVLSLCEMILMFVNFVLALIDLIFCARLKNSIMKDKQTEKQFKNAKTFAIIMAVAFALFFVYEIIAVTIMGKIYISLGIEMESTVTMSLVWTAIYAINAFLNVRCIKKTENILYKNSK